MEESNKGEIVFWGVIMGIVITSTGFFGYGIFILTQSFLKILI